jgi:UDP-N-acetylglucosamine 2-epimerase (non-hydrolysing)
MVVVGTRPEAVKIAPVMRALNESTEMCGRLTLSGQHGDMVDEILRLFQLSSHDDLGIYHPLQTPSSVVAAIVDRLPALLRSARPDAVLVQGDTSTAFAAALAAFHERIPVVHLEAGLRTDDPRLPFPEEANRRLIGRLAHLHLAPTAQCRRNLIAEGVPASDTVVTGNTVIDALMTIRDRAGKISNDQLAAWCAEDRPIVVVTMHRRESWGLPMQAVADAVATLARESPDVRFVAPLHPNRAVRECFMPRLSGLDNVLVLGSLPYPEMILLMARAYLMLTDSGGIQEEAPFFGTPVLVLRDRTERREAIELGVSRLVGCNRDRLVAVVRHLLHDKAEYRRMAQPNSPFGDGAATPRVMTAIAGMLGVGGLDAATPADTLLSRR